MTSSALDEALLPGTSQGIRERYASFAALAATATFGLDEPEVVVLDTETTGLSLNRDELIEIAAVIMKGPAVVASFQTFVNPLKPLPAEISALTGIVEDDLHIRRSIRPQTLYILIGNALGAHFSASRAALSTTLELVVV